MHIKRIHGMLEKLTECALHEFEKGIDCINAEEMGDVIDMIKDLSEAEYKSLIVKEMKECKEEEEAEEKFIKRMLKEERADEYKHMREQYGEEDGERRFYDNYRYANGRFAPKGRGMRRRGYMEMIPHDYRMNHDDIPDDEYLRDMDRPRGKMYYTPIERSRSGMMSRYDRAKRGYEERRAAYPGNMEEDRDGMKQLEELLNVVGSDIKELMPKMSQTEKVMTSQKMEAWARMLK